MYNLLAYLRVGQWMRETQAVHQTENGPMQGPSNDRAAAPGTPGGDRVGPTGSAAGDSGAPSGIRSFLGGVDLSAFLPLTAQGNSLYGRIISNTAGCGGYVSPHHPIQCEGMAYTDEGLECPHVKVPMLDERLQAALNISVCELLIEFAHDFKGLKCPEK